jgi:hypothetical protein
MSYTVLPASYRKNLKLTELRAQLQNSAKKLRGLETAVSNGSLDLGQAWVDYRGERAGIVYPIRLHRQGAGRCVQPGWQSAGDRQGR